MRWTALVVVAAVVLGCRDERSAPGVSAAAWFVDEAAARGVEFVHRSGAGTDSYLMPEIMGGGAALFDMDGDGDLDLYFVQGGGILADPASRPPNQLFENAGDGTFRDVTASSGAGDRGYGMGVACGDVEADGDVDLYVTNVGANVLLVNEGAARFVDRTAHARAGDEGWGTSAAFFDLDGDGFLDLYVVNYLSWKPSHEIRCFNRTGGVDYCDPQVYEAPAVDVLYRNRGDGTFEDVTEASGVASARGTGLGVAAADFDADGWCDVFVANDGMPDHLWQNRGDGTFVEEGSRRGCAVDNDGVAKAGMGVAVDDVDDDGDFDLMVCNLNDETDSFFENDGGAFLDRTRPSGLSGSRAFTRFGMGFVDFDDDGRLDLYQANGRVQRLLPRYSEDDYAEPNRLLRGVAGRRFEEVLPAGGTGSPLVATSRAAAFGDVDGDGGVDVVVVNRDAPAYLLMNRVPNRGGWIGVRVLDRRGGDAIGAIVSVTIGERRVTREVRAASSYLASHSPIVHFGLGRARSATNLRVRWPNGRTTEHGDFDAGRVVVLASP